MHISMRLTVEHCYGLLLSVGNLIMGVYEKLM